MVWPALDVTVISIRVPSSMTPSLDAPFTNDSIFGMVGLKLVSRRVLTEEDSLDSYAHLKQEFTL